MKLEKIAVILEGVQKKFRQQQKRHKKVNIFEVIETLDQMSEGTFEHESDLETWLKENLRDDTPPIFIDSLTRKHKDTLCKNTHVL